METLDTRIGGSVKYCKEYGTHEYDGGARDTFKEDINYRKQHISLIKTIPNSSTQPLPKPYANDPIYDSGCTGHYLDALPTIVNTREPSENPIKVKIPN